ncbi:acyl-CoA wax alcohol acyltransferase 1-like [Paramacrobiotus metropolitanus]|uniref:acyl-CoA wax alcohol acyltransferase 1-like n=1 Tax=Paramacrobiotus metropolitanus TaxID=2943436 RepID=UPI002445CA9A|nr:acyl-CoA wax alcohol acyltransferase 1-like [Paramacrobiotus metropolitanus]
MWILSLLMSASAETALRCTVIVNFASINLKNCFIVTGTNAYVVRVPQLQILLKIRIADGSFKMASARMERLNPYVQCGLQSLAVALHLLISYGTCGFSVVCFLLLLFTPLRWITVLYGIWYCYDWNCSSRGGRPLRWLCSLSVWNHFRDYFPIHIIKTADLDPGGKYVMGVHPHGASLALGALCTFHTEALGFRNLFPDIDVRLLALKTVFQIPLLREYALSFGTCDVSRKSIDYLLNRGAGSAVAIVVGGGKEVFEIDSKDYKLVLRNRKGFIRTAIQHGAHLVPVFIFGENDIYRLAFPRGSVVYKVQRFIQKHFGGCLLFVIGKGLFTKGAGLMPFRKPITMVVGASIPTEQKSDPSQAEIDLLHRHYLDRLLDLFETHKEHCGYAASKLFFIE